MKSFLVVLICLVGFVVLINNNPATTITHQKITVLPKGQNFNQAKPMLRQVNKTTMRRQLSYYFPFLLKNGLIYYEDDTIDETSASTSCNVANCMFCNALTPDTCLKCNTGFYLNGSSCTNQCPQGKIADTLRKRCADVSIANQNIISSKAYSIGSCLNMCGRILTATSNLMDCSCDAACILRGDCCNDYNTVNCPLLIDKSKSVIQQCQSVSLCELCDPSEKNGASPMCMQCQYGAFLYQGACYKDLPLDTQATRNNLAIGLNSITFK